MSIDDSYARETIKLIRDLSDDVTRLRQEVTRATAPLFPRIVGIEKRLDKQDAVLDAVETQQRNAAEWRENTTKVLEREHEERVIGQQRNLRLLRRISIGVIVLAAVIGVVLLKAFGVF